MTYNIFTCVISNFSSLRYYCIVMKPLLNSCLAGAGPLSAGLSLSYSARIHTFNEMPRKERYTVYK